MFTYVLDRKQSINNNPLGTEHSKTFFNSIVFYTDQLQYMHAQYWKKERRIITCTRKNKDNGSEFYWKVLEHGPP